MRGTIVILLIIIAGFFNGHMDHLMFHDYYYDPKKTWPNKYKKDSEGNFIPETKKPSKNRGVAYLRPESDIYTNKK